MKAQFANKQILVAGLGPQGQAACVLLSGFGVKVCGIGDTESPEQRRAAEQLRNRGISVGWGVSELPATQLDLAVLTQELMPGSPVLRALEERRTPVMGELELVFQLSNCLNLTIAGTIGKASTSELIERILISNQRKVIRGGGPERPLCAVVEQTRNADYLLIEADVVELQRTEFFRPAVAVLTNLFADGLGRFRSPTEYARAFGRLFRNQQAHDWVVVQYQALAGLRDAGVVLPGKTISFSATDATADLHLDRGLIISHLPNWSGPLLDLQHCSVRGPHHAENIMAALAVGHVLRLPLDTMREPVRTCSSGAHRCELVTEVNGVQFIDDSEAANLDAVAGALLAAPSGADAKPNVWLIAGGRDKALDYHDLGPVLSRRVKGAFLFDEAAERMRAAWSLFTPCTIVHSLLEAVHEAARNAVSGDVVLLSPSCSSFADFRNHEQCGEAFYTAVKSIDRGVKRAHPNIDGENRQN